MRQSTRTEVRRQQILDGAKRIILERGRAALTIANLSKASASSVGSIYHQFQDKAGVERALGAEAICSYRASLYNFIEGAPTLKVLTKKMVRHHLLYIRSQGEIGEILRALHGPADVFAQDPLRTRYRSALGDAVMRREVGELDFASYVILTLAPAWLFPAADADVFARAAWRSLR